MQLNFGKGVEKVKGEFENGGEDKEPGCESVRQKIKLLKAISFAGKGERKSGET